MPRVFFRTLVGLWVDWLRLANVPTKCIAEMTAFMSHQSLVSKCQSDRPNVGLIHAVNYAYDVNNRFDNRLSIHQLMTRSPWICGLWNNSCETERPQLEAIMLDILRLSNFLHRTGPTGPY
jgi:hypothetical protein